MQKKGLVFRYHLQDALLVLAALGQFAIMVIWAMNFNNISWGWNICFGVVMLILHYYNSIVITHNFIHTPFFSSHFLNTAFRVFNTLNLGLQQSLYTYHHLLHHKYNNDPVVNGSTNDPSSTYRYGKNGKQENWISYSLLSLMRDSTTLAFREIKRKGKLYWFWQETVILVIGITIAAVYNWQWLLFGFLPVFYFGWFLAHIENYFEHHHAHDFSNRFANAVSYYGKIYNRLMFNEGYHQEHHIKPGTHWTERPVVKNHYEKQMAAEGFSASKFPPLLAWHEKNKG